MALLRPKQPCWHCGGSVRQPRDPAMYLCPHCDKPGPWASPEQVTAWETWKAEKDRKEADRQAAEFQAELVRREARRRQLKAAASLTPIQVPGFVAQKSESVYFQMGADLAEWKKTRGHYEGGGGIRGVSVKVPGVKGARAYVGGLSKRQYVPGEEGWMITDSGTAIITSKRIIYKGSNKSVEWRFDKLVSLDADRSNGSLVISVTNRQKSHVLRLRDYGLFEAVLNAAVERYQAG